MKRLVLLALGALAGGCAHHDASSDPSVATNTAIAPSYDPTGSRNTMPPSAPAAPPATTTPATPTTTATSATPATTDTPAPGSAPEAPVTTAPAEQPSPGAPATGSTPPRGPAVDNTGVNERDRGHANPTPLDQSNASSDVAITAAVRRAVVGDGSLSFLAKNVKIITNGGHVVLRGPVKSAQERQEIEAKARAVNGVVDVDNQLEIKP